MNLNKVFVLGNLTRDPESRALPSGQSVVSFGVATNRFYTDKSGQKQQEVEYHNITAFGKVAETVANYLRKGSLVLVEGRLRTRNWEDPSGSKRSRTEIIAERIQLGPKGFRAQPPSSAEDSLPKKPTASPQEDIPVIEEDEEEIDVKDIPL